MKMWGDSKELDIKNLTNKSMQISVPKVASDGEDDRVQQISMWDLKECHIA